MVHRGVTEPPELAAATHLHGERESLAEHRAAVAAFAPEAVVDCYALIRRHAHVALDVYGAFEGFTTGRAVAAGRRERGRRARDDAALAARRDSLGDQ